MLERAEGLATQSPAQSRRAAAMSFKVTSGSALRRIHESLRTDRTRIQGEGVTHIFGMMGDGNAPRVGRTRQAGGRQPVGSAPRRRGSRHGRRMGASQARCRCLHGDDAAGVTQLATAFVTAARAQSPLVAFVGEFPRRDQDYVQKPRSAPRSRMHARPDSSVSRRRSTPTKPSARRSISPGSSRVRSCFPRRWTCSRPNSRTTMRPCRLRRCSRLRVSRARTTKPSRKPQTRLRRRRGR